MKKNTLMLKLFKTLLLVMVGIGPMSFAQTRYIGKSQELQEQIDRLEALHSSALLNWNSFAKPYTIQNIAPFLTNLDSSYQNADAIDKYSIEKISNAYLVIPSKYDPKRSFLKSFYKNQYNGFVYNEPNIIQLAINPLLNFQVGSEKNKLSGTLVNTRGIAVNGIIVNKIAFYAAFCDNQENPFSYVDNLASKQQAFPGVDYYSKRLVNQYDYLTAQTYIQFPLVKKYIQAQIGYGKQFWGYGQRSLYLSDYGASAPYLQLHSQFKKFSYDNLYMELTPQYTRGGGDKALGHKYASFHHLSMQLHSKLEVGVFEAIVFGRTNHYEWSYLNPLILLRQAERSQGSPDNALMGFDFKWKTSRKAHFYGQLLFDEFKLKELSQSKGWWGNKYGFQLGLKTYDLFKIPHLDAQIEFNQVRPFTYARDSASNYTHYNQALAHPLGAGFRECIGILRYQWHKKWSCSVQQVLYAKGVDTGSSNFGNNIFSAYSSRVQDYGFQTIAGVKSKGAYTNIHIAYECIPNLYIEAGFIQRTLSYQASHLPDEKTSAVYSGIRWNMARRTVDF
jgi:hypothetical protein